MAARRHIDCRNMAPLDVVKGVCHRSGEIVAADADACESVDELLRCRSCGHYAQGSDPWKGACRAEPHHPMTYPDLAAVTCPWYEAAP